MSGNPGKGSKGSATKRELMEQLASMLGDGDEDNLVERLNTLERRLDEIESRSGEGGDLAQKLKKVISSLLLESGFLEKFVNTTVDERVGSGDIRSAVQKEIEGYLASDSIKELLDEKFRAVTLYLKTDVIPNAVRQALRDRQHA